MRHWLLPCCNRTSPPTDNNLNLVKSKYATTTASEIATRPRDHVIVLRRDGMYTEGLVDIIGDLELTVHSIAGFDSAVRMSRDFALPSDASRECVPVRR